MQDRTRRTELPRGAERLRPDDPASIGAYAVIGRLGEGGMGHVYLGRAAAGGEGVQHVAIKVIRPELAADSAFRARFGDEVSNAQRVASFCTAAVLDHGEADGRPYLVTEYVDGTPLEDYIEAHGALPAGTLHGVAVGVAAALTAIHSAGLIHRDLKPSNVLLSVSGPRVIDFGIARASDSASQHTQAGFVVGTPGWMAPEQVLRGEVSQAADIFAWACLVAIAGTGRHPHGTGNAMVMAGRAQHAEADLAGLGEPLRGLVVRALDPDPGRRPDAQGLLLSLVGGQGGAGEAAAGMAGAGAAGAAGPAGTAILGSADQEQAAAELSRTWQADALPPDLVPPPWVPPSPPAGMPQGGGPYATPPPPYIPPQTPPPYRTPPPPAPGHPPYRTPPPLGPQPYQGGRPARQRSGCLRGCLITGVIVIAAMIAGAVAFYYGGRPKDGRIGEAVKDGQFTFVAQSVRCGVGVRAATPTKGKFCQVRFTVRNSGDKTRTLAAENQRLKNDGDDTRTGWTMLDGRTKLKAKLLSPGARFSGTLVFDVPTAFQPYALTLHDARASRGVRVPVD